MQSWSGQIDKDLEAAAPMLIGRVNVCDTRLAIINASAARARAVTIVRRVTLCGAHAKRRETMFKLISMLAIKECERALST